MRFLCSIFNCLILLLLWLPCWEGVYAQTGSLARVPNSPIRVAQNPTLENLFNDSGSPVANQLARAFQPTAAWRGFSQLEFANVFASPAHASKLRLRSELANLGQLNPNVKWKLSARLDYDAIHDISNFYPRDVRRDQRFEFVLRENYLDVSAGDFDVRIGRQHIIWGEMVGLFFADVVSAKDMREFVLQDFDQMRIPQWAIRTEYSKEDFHADFVWIPFASVDKIGRPGAEFYPFALPGNLPVNFLHEDRSGLNPSNSNYGVRLSQLISGWDLAAFYYHSRDATPTFHLVSQPGGPLTFQARHETIDQIGSTLTKDLGHAVLKGELVYTDGRRFNVARLTAPSGLIAQDTIDYALGLDFTMPRDIRLNLQFFQRVFLNHDRDIFADKRESGGSIFLQSDLWRDIEAQVLFIHSFNRSEWMLRPRITWNLARDWRLAMGADLFDGPATGLFGRFANNDRVYTELRFSF
ncbi:conserved exported hypothetical protein [Nitrosomonas mobilis]|uniref:Alginate export domain-containing protein n=1 Tax=Nitrosomonas mobilis TaxID=51642 RepID=A0A1G5SES1_9PROT|nr:conserved exported hypothetical protein [Nitrosomonas mobilis]